MTDLIAEATATKNAIDEATQGVQTYMEKQSRAPPPAPSPAPAPPIMEADLFGFGPPPGAGSLPSQDIQSHDPLPPPSGMSQPYSSDAYASAPASEPEPELSPSPSPEAESEPEPSAYSLPDPASLAAPSAPRDVYGGRPPQQQHQQAHDFNQNAHRRNESTASAFGFGDDNLMGGGSLPAGYHSSSNDNKDDLQVMGAKSYGSAISVSEINELKMKAKEAEDLARDAQENSRQKMAQVNELRRVADEATAEARRQQEDGKDTKKKKGFMGRNKKAAAKKDVKEAERLAADAKEKQEKLMAAQAEANDAQAFAMETKREAERLRQEVEDAEIAAASAASMQEVSAPASKSAPQSNGFMGGAAEPYMGGAAESGYMGGSSASGYMGGSSEPPSYGMPPYYGGDSNGPPSYYGQQQPQPPQQPNGEQYGGFGYNPNVMGGGGGIDIPTPTGDAYDNPFSS